MKGASYLYLEKDGKILLLRRHNTGHMDGYYSFIAGHVDPGETFTEAVVREAKEEAGIIVKEQDLDVVHVNHRPGVNYLDMHFAAKKWKGNAKNMEPDKCDDMRWFDKNKLPDNLLPNVRHVLEQMKKGKFYSDSGK